MHDPTLTRSVRNALMLALGLTATTLAGTGGCADRGGHEICTDTKLDYETCGYEVDPDTGLPLGHVEEVCFPGADGCDPCDAEAITGAAIEQAEHSCEIMDIAAHDLAVRAQPCGRRLLLQSSVGGQLGVWGRRSPAAGPVRERTSLAGAPAHGLTS